MSKNHRVNLRRILCPIGLTPDSDGALRYAGALARNYAARLSVLHCIDRQQAAVPLAFSQTALAVEDAVTKYLGHLTPTAFETEIIIAEGEPQTVIAQEAANRQTDLIVMRSRRPHNAALLGSTAESLCRTAPCPVLVTHSQNQRGIDPSSTEAGLRRVLVAYDFSSDAELALSYALSLAYAYQAELHLLHVVPPRLKSDAPEIALLPFGVETSANEIGGRLGLVVPDESRSWCRLKSAVREGRPYREALAYAEEQDIDLICMGASGTGFGIRTLFGSNTDRVLRQAPCPVLIARPLRPTVMAMPRAAHEVDKRNGRSAISKGGSQ